MRKFIEALPLSYFLFMRYLSAGADAQSRKPLQNCNNRETLRYLLIQVKRRSAQVPAL
ncbi:hypothetical protein K503DRAFT_777672 [Rhizopogon vinicolor AM-OR11-026]|uniref:Uncharacterized protein n=1 Tax=Rhizopogon vinicolor AM-OR11-026 TaxID=1314800 RepID=A0A1B7MFG8_9AGAM|nr:hypothetical protein K503DRAFT_777672 [Rhizopogon vinicolor AM-OR11-026]